MLQIKLFPWFLNSQGLRCLFLLQNMHPPKELCLGTDNPQGTRKMLVPSEQFCFARLSADLRNKTESQESLLLFAVRKHHESLRFPHLWCDRGFAYPASNPQQTGNHPSKLLQLQGTQPPGRAGQAQPFQNKEWPKKRHLTKVPGDFSFHRATGQSLGIALSSSSDLQRKGPQISLLSTESSSKDRNTSLTILLSTQSFFPLLDVS